MHLKDARTLRKVTQGTLANKAGVTQAYVSFIEVGKRTPSKRVQDKIEAVLNMKGLINWENGDVQENWANTATSSASLRAEGRGHLYGSIYLGECVSFAGKGNFLSFRKMERREKSI